MKIEIELHELEQLKAELHRTQTDLKEANEFIKTFSKEELTHKAIVLSLKLFDNYMRCVFKNLGFDEPKNNPSVDIPLDNLNRFIGKDWWKQDGKIDVTVGANVTNNFKRAFLSIGIIPPGSMKNQQELEDFFKL